MQDPIAEMLAQHDTLLAQAGGQPAGPQVRGARVFFKGLLLILNYKNASPFRYSKS